MTAPSTQVRRLVILGHSGFIGSRVTARVQAMMPDFEIEGVSLPELDLTRVEDAERLAGIFAPDVCVIMTAAVKKQLGDTLEAFRHNIAMITNVCDVLARRPVGRFVYFSSAAVYGEDVHNTAISEETPVCPRTFYGVAKYTSELLLTKVAGAAGTSLLLLRPPTVYGSGDTTNTYGPAGFVRAVLRHEPVTLWGDGGELREFVHVDDLAEAVVRLSMSDVTGPINVATGRSHTFRDVLDIVERLNGAPIEVANRSRSKDRVDNAFVADGLRAALPELRFRSLEEGIGQTWRAEREALIREEGQG